MPEIKLKHVVSCSSEDKKFPADNLLKPEGTSKWRGSTPGQKHIATVLQFEKACQIHQIDVGNDGAAFIEVLVGRSTQKEEEYQVILVASSFMNPAESRGGQNLNRVRIFNKESLSKAVCEEKWDRVKVVASQPFNKNTPYGVSFVKFHSPPESKENSHRKDQVTLLGGFKLKEDIEKDLIPAGSLFANRSKEKSTDTPLTGAAAARAASRLAAETTGSPSNTSKPKPQAHAMMQQPGDRPSSEHLGKVKRKHSEEPDSRAPQKKQSTSVSSTCSEKPSAKKIKSEYQGHSGTKEFCQLMSKVVFVMSGYQNPERAKIRDRAIEMGGQYRPDWGRGCTHLICAFENTPKFQQVEGKGRIVDKNWILDSYKQKKLVPWRKYRIGRARTPPGGSDSDSKDEKPALKKTPTSEVVSSKHKASTPKPSSSGSSSSAAAPNVFEEDTDVSEEDTDVSEEDTDDEIRKVREGEAEKQTRLKMADISNSEHGKEMENGKDASRADSMEGDLPELPDFFKSKCLFLYGKMSPTQRRTLIRYITAYDGQLEEYMNEKVNFVITEAEWDDDFDGALADNPGISFVRPAWIHACHDKQKLLPHQKFVIVPK